MRLTDKPFDISFHTEGGRFNFRVGAIIRHGGKMLLIKNRETTYLYTVGGRVHYDETTEEALIREVKEETGITMEVERILFFMEQFFDEEVTGEHFHEIGVYYLMKDDEALENVVCDSVTERGVMEELIWIPEDELDRYYIAPVSLAKRLNSLPEHLELLVENSLDNVDVSCYNVLE